MIIEGIYVLVVVVVAVAVAGVKAASEGTLATVYATGGPLTGQANEFGNYEFLGIRYANAARWEAPTAVSPWTAAIDALAFQRSCAQICQSVLCPQVIGEDCLFLNIYTPVADAATLKTTAGGNAATASQPVVVFFHGGSFDEGGAGMAPYDGSELAASLDVVVVTFNYRLGVFGYFNAAAVDSTATAPPPSSAINFGILDQRMAIEWVQDNIAAFGGDPTRVTYLGQSAGAQSILLHMAHPATAEMITNVVLMSPPALALTTAANAQASAALVARQLGCANLACMRAKTMRQVLTANVADTGTGVQALSQMVYREMSPVVDGVDVLMNPFDVLATPQLGGVSNETALFVNETNPGDLSSPLFNVIIDGVFSPNTDAISQLYGSNSEGYLDSRKPDLVRIISDWIFTCPQRQSVRAATSSSSSVGGGVWAYYLEAPWLGGTDEAMGDMCADMACHTTDLSYLFRTPDDASSQAVTAAFRAYLAAFIAGGSTTLVAPTGYPTWTAASSDPARYPILRFPAPGSGTTVYTPILEPTHPLAARCDLWDAAGYEYASLTDPATISANKQAAAALSLIPLAATLGALVLFVLTEWALLALGIVVRQRLARLFRAVDEDAKDLQDAVKQLQTQQDILASVPGAKPVQVGLGKPTEAVSQSIESLNEEAKPNPVLVACRSVTYRAGDMDGAKRLLDDVNVAFLPGTVTAIMGPSGAGKTTLLSLLNRRLKAGSSVEDRIYFSGKPLSSMTAARFRALTGLVAQHDAPYYGLTVREVMIFNAMLELPSSLQRVEKVRRINHLLRILNLLPCADVVIQKPESNLGGISGGQMRRLSIAVALLKRPSVLFMDEPTSGLDAKSSMDVGKAMNHLASQGYTIICSIHQPRPEMFAMFDQVIVLVYGRLLFAGRPEDTVQHFQELRTKLAVRNNDVSMAASHYYADEPVGVETNETGSILVKRFRDENEEEDGEGPNPADLVLDVASTILSRDAAWAARQWQPAEIDIEAVPLASKEAVPASPAVATSRTANNNGAMADKGMHNGSFTPLFPPAPPMNSTDMVNSTVSKALNIASKYVAVEDEKLVVPVRPTTTRRASDSILYQSPAKRLSVLRRAVELSAVEQMESGSGRGYPHTAPLGGGGADSQILFPDPPPVGAAAETTAASAAATSGRLSLAAQVTVLTGRWWTTRPLARKFNMMIISAGGVWILSLLQRRAGDDVLSLVLQTKGLALACIGLPALKNIHISFDYYEDRDIYNFDSQNGTVTALAFFLHRVVYETANATVEGFIAVISAYFILGCNPDPYRIGTAMSLFVAYYNCTTTLFTLVYCTRLGRPEARSVAFFSQAVLAIVSGVWIKKGDATVYDWIAWAQYLNPTYWALSPLVRANAVHAGECLLENAGYCQASMGDVVAEEARADHISPREGMLALGIIWLAMRALQLVLLYRDTYWAAFWGSVKKSWADWVRAQTTRATTVAVHETQTGASLEKMPDTYDHIGVKGNMVELDKDVA
ncbi:hypothetical protein HDU87_004946 [Geranomyces variabilis]|uniref:ABC transporter domain-containing protein n=1 Tax=Geranomyces variabilis TaxID=109894 RepID=A0AAD5THH1_9FUNG|nr:hypothetical protein HDU87_004946 [Geranomyces variabilis]